MKIIVSPDAAEYLRAERAYIAKFNIQASRTTIQRLRAAMRMLMQYPEAGSSRLPVARLRCPTVPPYLIDYRVSHDAIIILSIRYGRQEEPAIDVDDTQDFE